MNLNGALEQVGDDDEINARLHFGLFQIIAQMVEGCDGKWLQFQIVPQIGVKTMTPQAYSEVLLEAMTSPAWGFGWEVY